MFPDAALQDESIIMKGEKNPFYGRRHNEEFKQKERRRVEGTKNPLAGKKISDKWNDPNSSYRKMMASIDYRERMSAASKLSWSQIDESKKRARFEKMRQTKLELGQWLPDHLKEPYQAYEDNVRKLTELSFRKNFYEIESAKKRGKKFNYDLDHKLSIFDGFRLGVEPEILASHFNLRVIPRNDNARKNRYSSIGLQELLQLIEESGLV